MKNLKWLSRIIIIWPLVLPVVWLILISQYDGAYIFPARGEIVDYQFLRNARRIPTLIAFCFGPLSLFVIAMWLVGQIVRKKATSIFAIGVGGIALLLLVSVNMMACWSTFGIALSRFEHFARAEIRGHVYYIDSIWKVGVGHDSRALFALFECDSAGVMCKIVHSELFHPTEEEYQAMQVALIPHPDGNKISMQIDGEIVYTHST